MSYLLTTLTGNIFSQNGNNMPYTFVNPGSIAFDISGNIIIAERNTNTLLKLDKNNGIITTIAGTGNRGFSGDNGPGNMAEFNNITGVTIDKTGSIYITDTGNNRIRKINSDGRISTVAGNGIQGYGIDGELAIDSSITIASDVVVDSVGNIYFSEPNGHRIRKIDVSTSRITTIAGNGIQGFFGDGGLAIDAKLRRPTSIILDELENILYINDVDNSRIRKIDIFTGIITTIAGNGSYDYSGDGGLAIDAGLGSPQCLVLDHSGNIYFSSGYYVIRKIDVSTGIITTIAGDGNYNPTNSSQINDPDSIILDTLENVYFVDRGNKFIRKLTYQETLPISDICFPSNTLITTDQGKIYIDRLQPELNTIRNKKIVSITKTITQDNYLVCFEKNALGCNIPSKKTIISKNHLIFYKGQMRKAKDFINNIENVYKIKYDGEILYNVLLETYDKMIVNNLICDTLHPDNVIAKIYNILPTLNIEEKEEFIQKINNHIKKNNIFTYKK